MNNSIEERKNRLIGAAYLRAGRLVDADDIYGKLPGGIAEMSLNDLIACGDACAKDNDFQHAIQAYARAGATGKLIETARSRMGKNDHDARDAFAAAEDWENLVALGDKHFKDDFDQSVGDGVGDHLDFAKECYALASAREKLVQVGIKFEETKKGDQAIDAYTSAGAVVRLVDLGQKLKQRALEQYVKQEDQVARKLEDGALDAFRAAGARDELQALAEQRISVLKPVGIHDQVALLEVIYNQELKIHYPEELLQAKVDEFTQMDWSSHVKDGVERLCALIAQNADQPEAVQIPKRESA